MGWNKTHTALGVESVHRSLFWPCRIGDKLLSGISMVSKSQWLKSVGITALILNGILILFSNSYGLNSFLWLNGTALWAVVHLWIIGQILKTWILASSASGGVFWVMLKAASFAALALILVESRKSTTPLVILTGLTAFIVVPIVGSFFWSRRVSSDASRT